MMCCIGILWVIWLAGNSCVFRGRASWAFIWESAIFLASLWSLASVDFDQYCLADLQCGLRAVFYIHSFLLRAQSPHLGLKTLFFLCPFMESSLAVIKLWLQRTKIKKVSIFLLCFLFIVKYRQCPCFVRNDLYVTAMAG